MRKVIQDPKYELRIALKTDGDDSAESPWITIRNTLIKSTHGMSLGVCKFVQIRFSMTTRILI